jgi:hypothetical protein
MFANLTHRFLFDSKLLYDKQPSIWKDTDVVGTSSTYIDKTVVLYVSTNGAKRIRETYKRFYSKSMTVYISGILGNGSMGLFDNTNGYYYKKDAIVKRKNGTDIVVERHDWANNKFYFDMELQNVFYFTFETITNSVYCGIVIGNQMIELHHFMNTNHICSFLPIRYEINTPGSIICTSASVVSIPGNVVKMFSFDRETTGLDLTTESHTASNNVYPLLTFQQVNKTYLTISSFQVICSLADTLFRWGIYTLQNSITLNKDKENIIHYNNTTISTNYFTNTEPILSGYAIGTFYKELDNFVVSDDVLCLAVQPITHPSNSHGNQSAASHIYYGCIVLQESI